MNKDALTLLSCSGSLALMLLTTNTAQARTLPSQYTGFVGTKTAQAVSFPLAQGGSSSVALALDPSSDTIGDLAIAKFGCDCPNCRNQIVQMIQSGQLSLPH